MTCRSGKLSQAIRYFLRAQWHWWKKFVHWARRVVVVKNNASSESWTRSEHPMNTNANRKVGAIDVQFCASESWTRMLTEKWAIDVRFCANQSKQHVYWSNLQQKTNLSCNTQNKHAQCESTRQRSSNKAHGSFHIKFSKQTVNCGWNRDETKRTGWGPVRCETATRQNVQRARHPLTEISDNIKLVRGKTCLTSLKFRVWRKHKMRTNILWMEYAKAATV